MAEQKRKYTFKDTAYWEAKRQPKMPNGVGIQVQSRQEQEEPWTPSQFDLSRASTAYSPGRAGSTNTNRGGTKVGRNAVSDALVNLRDLPLPYVDRNGKINIRDAVQLCQRVYANIAIFRNTIDIMTEFSCADIYLTGGNAASKKFADNWLKKIGVNKLLEIFFREFYRSGNVFILRFDGAFSDDEFKKIKTALAAIKNKIPIRYTVLNPSDIMIYTAASFENAPYRKVMSEYELQALRDRKTDEDKALYRALPDDIKKVIDNGTWNSDGVYMPIPSDRLTAVFYKKQPYEPFAIPFGYPVLRDLNHKEELKKIDQSISRTIDNVILLVTMGEKKDAEGNGMNPAAMQKMSELLQQESVGRVLVSDYTTKFQFIIPEIGEILNPLKYQVVNQDIKEGLLNVLASDEKFATGMMKASIFLERLKEGRKAAKDFLQAELNAVCRNLGFKQIPQVNFQEIDLKDEVQFNKVYTRLMEIGLLTPEQGFKAMETGILPEADELDAAQEKYVKDRKAGKYNPLVGGVPMAISPEGDANRKVQMQLGQMGKGGGTTPGGGGGPNPNATNNGRPAGSTGTPKSGNKVSPKGSNAELVELAKVKHLVSLSKLKTTAERVSDLMNKSENAVKARYSLQTLNQKQQDLVYRLAANVMSTTKAEDWGTQLDAVLKEPEVYLTTHKQNEISEAVDKIAAEHQIDTYSASILYHSKWEA